MMNSVELGLLFIKRLLKLNTECVGASDPQPVRLYAEFSFRPLLDVRDDLMAAITALKERDICHFTDALGIQFSLVHIGESICLLGPYVGEHFSKLQARERFSELDIDIQHLREFYQYVDRLPRCSQESLAYATHTLLQGVYGYQSKASVYYINLNEPHAKRLQSEAAGAPITSMPQQLFSNVISTEEQIGVSQRLESQLYEQMMKVETEKALQTLKLLEQNESRSSSDFESRKQAAAVLCTMMRQTAIQSGVQPLLSELRARYFLALIRKSDAPEKLQQTKIDMLAQFIDLIRKERLQSLSPKTRQVVSLIMSDLSGDLSVKRLAKEVNLSANYLSSVFKKEMKQSLSVYVRNQRLEISAQYLIYTSMPIHHISVCVGIEDMSYFTKQFKGKYGVTPSTYRNKFHVC